MANLLWLQGGACSGNTMSFLNAEEPSACDLVTDFGINVLWHPSLGLELGENLRRLLDAIVKGEMPLDIFVFEGTVVNAPNGTGEWNRFCGRPMKDWVADLAKVATFTVAVGDCATWGGIPATAPNPSESEGLQFLKRQHGGFLGKDYKSKAGLPARGTAIPMTMGMSTVTRTTTRTPMTTIITSMRIFTAMAPATATLMTTAILVITATITTMTITTAMARRWSRSRRASSPRTMRSRRRTAPGSQAARSWRSIS